MARRALLEHIQERLLNEFDSITHEEADPKASFSRDAAVIAKELRAVSAELESLPTGVRSTVDDLAAKRAARRAEATG